MTKRAIELWTLILAAGGSTRLGIPKQLLRFRAQTAIARTVRQAQELTPGRVIVVVGAHPHRVRGAARRAPGRPRVVTNPSWRDGMSGSLRIGLVALPRQAAAALLLVVDQPLVGLTDLEKLVAAWSQQPARPAASAYASRLGIPAILPRRFWPRASRASGDVGAREILRDPGVGVTVVNMPAAAFDVDTREDLARGRPSADAQSAVMGLRSRPVTQLIQPDWPST